VLVGVAVTDGQQNVLLFSSDGKAVCFDERGVRSMGRTAGGVRGIRLKKDQKVISLIITKGDGIEPDDLADEDEDLDPDSELIDLLEEDTLDAGDSLEEDTLDADLESDSLIISEATILTITENGYGKRTRLNGFRGKKRGGQGVIAIQTAGRNGALVGAVLVNASDEIMLITNGGTLVRTRVNEISVVGRNAQGVTVIRLDKGEKVVGVDRIDGLGDEEEDDIDAEFTEIDSPTTDKEGSEEE
jgi:DNA gyrase subunit A